MLFARFGESALYIDNFWLSPSVRQAVSMEGNLQVVCIRDEPRLKTGGMTLRTEAIMKNERDRTPLQSFRLFFDSFSGVWDRAWNLGFATMDEAHLYLVLSARPWQAANKPTIPVQIMT